METHRLERVGNKNQGEAERQSLGLILACLKKAGMTLPKGDRKKLQLEVMILEKAKEIIAQSGVHVKHSTDE